MVLERDDREEQKEFLSGELVEAQDGVALAMKKVTAAKNRIERKKQLADPSTAGPAQQVDELIKDKTVKTLKVRIALP